MDTLTFQSQSLRDRARRFEEALRKNTEEQLEVVKPSQLSCTWGPSPSVSVDPHPKKPCGVLSSLPTKTGLLCWSATEVTAGQDLPGLLNITSEAGQLWVSQSKCYSCHAAHRSPTAVPGAAWDSPPSQGHPSSPVPWLGWRREGTPKACVSGSRGVFFQKSWQDSSPPM